MDEIKFIHFAFLEITMFMSYAYYEPPINIVALKDFKPY
jgi:hypothetical protein